MHKKGFFLFFRAHITILYYANILDGIDFYAGFKICEITKLSPSLSRNPQLHVK